uniref:Uncharacterized protein n=1 Tax=Anguilla anguilla TaxID=7936 RepID=A0A0E9QVW3_ANGAN
MFCNKYRIKYALYY